MRDRRLLVVAVTVALVFSIAWFWRAASDGVPDRVQVPEGTPASVGGVAYSLESLQATDRIASGAFAELVAVKGATLVRATVRYDASTVSEPVYCSLKLVAGETTWDAELGWVPPKGESSSCDSNTAGAVSAVFEVPQGFLGSVQGIEVINPDGADPVLLGRPA
jgi:hypothetical protein